jgi:hypothetical protein
VAAALGAREERVAVLAVVAAAATAAATAAARHEVTKANAPVFNYCIY